MYDFIQNHVIAHDIDDLTKIWDNISFSLSDYILPMFFLLLFDFSDLLFRQVETIPISIPPNML